MERSNSPFASIVGRFCRKIDLFLSGRTVRASPAQTPLCCLSGSDFLIQLQCCIANAQHVQEKKFASTALPVGTSELRR